MASPELARGAASAADLSRAANTEHAMNTNENDRHDDTSTFTSKEHAMDTTENDHCDDHVTSVSEIDDADGACRPDSLTAFEKRAGEIAAVRDEDLVPINIDVLAAISTAIGVLTKVAGLKSRIAALAEVDHAQIDALPDYANALAWTHEIWRAASAPAEVVPELAAAATRMRNRFAADVNALAERGLVNADRAARLHSGVGYRAVVDDLMGLSGLLRGSWDIVAGKTAVDVAEIQRAEILAGRMLAALGHREQAPATVAEASRMRERAFTLFVRSYDQLRRAVTFLRWNEGDAATLVPSLWSGRGNSNVRSKNQDVPKTDVASAASTQASPPPPAPPAQSAQPKAAANAIPQGLPGAKPFTD